MLTHSFSYLPIKIGNEWKILADADLAKYLADKGPDGRKQTVEDAKKNGLKIKKADKVKSTYSKLQALEIMQGKAAVCDDRRRPRGYYNPI